MSKEFNPGKINPIIKVIARIVANDPALVFQNLDKELIAKVEEEIPELKDKSRCANCAAPMIQYSYNLNVLNTALVINMAKDVKRRIGIGMEFTEANMVHVPTLDTSDAIRHKTTDCAKLGLLAKYKVDGKHIHGMWVITTRGFEALRGKEVPTGIIVWRGRIIERPGYVTTFDKIRSMYQKKIDKHVKKHNEVPRGSYQDEVIKYNQNEWINFAGFHDGKLF